MTLDDGTTGITARIVEVTDLDAGHGYKTLVVEGRHASPDANPPYAAPGKWYWIGEQTVSLDACQSGEWDAAADQDSSGNFTEFTLPREAYVSDFQVGWLLQPDINVAVYLPITSISAGSLTVSGSYGSLVASSSGTHFRIYAPPGVERTGPFFSGFEAGTLSRFTSASSSRNLFGGYRYESPLAGVRDDLWMAVQGRQSGKNFTGLHYTLHRHYDPHLMRFTSTDPAAAPFFNLYSYCGGNPASGYDPDGLFFMSEYVGMWRKIITGKNRDGTKATWADIGESAWAGNPVTGLLPEAVNPFGFYNDIVKSDSVGEWAWKRTKKAPGIGMVLSQGEQFVNTVADSWKVGEEQGVGSGVGNFLLQRTLSNPTPLVGSTARTIYSGYRATQTGDWWDFAEDLASMGDDACVLATIVLGDKAGRPSPAGKVEPPRGLKPGTGKFGNEMHKRMGDWMKEQYPRTEFRLDTKPGRNGIDVPEHRTPKGYRPPAFEQAEFKPRTSSGQKSFNNQMNNIWHKPAGSVMPYTYDAHGYIYHGWAPGPAYARYAPLGGFDRRRK